MKLFLIAPALAAFTTSATAAPIKQLDPHWQGSFATEHGRSSVAKLNRHAFSPHPTHGHHPLASHQHAQPPHNPQQPAPHPQRHVQGQPLHYRAQQPPPLKNILQLQHHEAYPEVLLQHLRSPSPLPGDDAPPRQRLHTNAKLAHLKAIEASCEAINYAAAAHEHQLGDRVTLRNNIATERKAIKKGIKGYNAHQAAAKDPNPDSAWDVYKITDDEVNARIRTAHAKDVIARNQHVGVRVVDRDHYVIMPV